MRKHALLKLNLVILLSSFIAFNSCKVEDEVMTENEFENFTDVDYRIMMKKLANDIDLVLLENKPSNISLNDYKVKLINGEVKLSKKQEMRLLVSTEKINSYGKFLAKKNNIKIDINDSAETIALGGLYLPSDNLQINKYEKPLINNDIQNNNSQNRMVIENMWMRCALAALGADAIWALSGSSASAWTVATMTRAFSAVAKRFLGPIGVAIAVTSFGICIATS